MLNDTRKFAELYSKLPKEKKEIVIAYMAGMEAQERLSSEEPSAEMTEGADI
ncbi:hypothetical protein [Marvinbryantia formatexigens]|nr:hypothetical protein [Marvinbryantia formatexigens]